MIKLFHVDESDYFFNHLKYLMLGPGSQLSMLELEDMDSFSSPYLI